MNRLKPSFFGLFLSVVTSVVAAQSLVVAADEWCPYNCIPGQSPGYVIEILQQIYANDDLNIDYQLMPWTRAIETAKRGRIDAIVGAIPIEAPDFIYPDSPAGLVRHTFYTSNTEYKPITSIDQLPDKQLGVIQDYSYGSSLTDYIAQPEHRDQITVTSGKTALRQLALMLQARRIDVLVEDESVFRYFLKQSETHFNFRPIGVTAEDFIYVAFSPAKKESRVRAKQFDVGIQALRESGQLASILMKYGLSDWQQEPSVQGNGCKVDCAELANTEH